MLLADPAAENALLDANASRNVHELGSSLFDQTHCLKVELVRDLFSSLA